MEGSGVQSASEPFAAWACSCEARAGHVEDSGGAEVSATAGEGRLEDLGGALAPSSGAFRFWRGVFQYSQKMK
jgi:hypothetical protein